MRPPSGRRSRPGRRVAAAANIAGSRKTSGPRFGTLKYRATARADCATSSARNRIVRWKQARQCFVYDTGRKKSMSHRMQVGIAAVAALVLAGGAFYWLHGRSDAAPRAITSVPSAAVPAKPPSETSKEAAAGNAPIPRTEIKKAA